MNEERVYFLSLDLETGGLMPIRDRFDHSRLGSPILSYGAILLDENLKYVGHRDGLVRPAETDSEGNKLVINDEALAVNQLDPEQCRREGITVEEMCIELEKLCEQSNDAPIVLTGSNPEFDRSFWQEAARRSNRKIPRIIRRRAIDTYEMNVRWMYENGLSMREATDNGALAKFMKHIGVPHAAHTALGDAEAAVQCLRIGLLGHLPRNLMPVFNEDGETK